MNMQVVTCPNCNGQVQIDASREFGFCSYCGTKIVFEREAPLNATQVFADNRSAALDEISKIMDHFVSVSDDFRRVDAVNDQFFRPIFQHRWMKYTSQRIQDDPENLSC